MDKVKDALEGLVRPVVTLSFAFATVWGWLVAGKLSDDAFLGLAGMVIGFWFTQRQAAKSENSVPPTS